jgi:hypothetical protein
MTMLAFSDPENSTIGDPASTTVKSLLMEDAVSAEAVSVRQGINQEAVFANPYLDGKEEALLIDDTGHLSYLRRTALSDTGWQQEQVTGGAKNEPLPAREIVVVVHHSDLTVWAIMIDPVGKPRPLELTAESSDGVSTCRWIYHHEGVAWRSPHQPLGIASQLSVHYDGKVPWIIGLDGEYGTIFYLIATIPPPGGEHFDGVAMPQQVARQADDFAAGHLRSVTGMGYNLSAYVRTGQTLTRYAYDSGWAFHTRPVSAKAARLVGVFRSPTPAGDVGCLYLDTDGALVTSNVVYQGSIFDHVTTTRGLGFLTASGWQDINGMMHVYGIDDSNTLKVLHQTAWDVSGGPIWTQAVATDGTKTPMCLGVHPMVVSFSLDPYPDYLPSELVKMAGARARDQFCVCTQDINTTRWSTEKVRLPSGGKPHPVTHYVSEVTLLDGSGKPMADHQVTVTAESLVEIQSGGASYLVGPGHGAVLATGPLGKLTVSIDANSISPPVLHVDALGLEHGAVIQPATDIHNYLAGNGTLASQNGTFSRDALKGARADGKPIVIPGKDDDEIEYAVHSTQQAFAQANGKQLTSRLFRGEGPAPVIHGYSIGRGADGKICYHEFATPAQAQAHIESIRALDNYGGLWDDFIDFASDVWEGIKNGVIEVFDAAITATATVFIYIGGKIIELVDFIIDTVEKAVHAAEAVIRMVVEAIGKVIDWLKALFNFSDIWDTKNAIYGLVKQLPPIINRCADHYRGISSDWFSQQIGKVTSALDAIKAQYGDTRMGDFGNKTPNLTSSNGSAVRADDVGGNPQANWLQTKMMSEPVRGHLAAALEEIPLPGPILDAGKDLWNVLTGGAPGQSPLDHLVKAVSDIGEAMAALFNVADPEAGGKLAVIKLIDCAEQIAVAVLTFLDRVVQKVFDLVKAFSGQLLAFFETELPLGPLNTLWEWLQELARPGQPAEPLTLGNFFLLVAAVPITVVGKLIMGVDHPPFPGGKFPVLPMPGDAGVLGANGLDATACALANGFAALLTWTVYNGLDVATDWTSGGLTLNITYWIFTFLAFVALCVPATYTGKAWSTWWVYWFVWIAACVVQLVTILAGRKLSADGKDTTIKNYNGWVGGAIGFGLGGTAMLAGIFANQQEDDGVLSLIVTITGCISTLTAMLIPWANKLSENGKFHLTLAKSALDGLSNLASGMIGMVTAFIAWGGRVAFNADPITCDPGTANSPYTFTLPFQGTNTPLAFTVTGGSLPDGLTLDPVSGTLSGKTAATGDFTFNVQVTDSYYPGFTDSAVAKLQVAAG